MNRLTDKLVALGIGEEESDEWHFPSYTEGCWGKPGRKLCWCCKVRYPLRMISLFRRERSTTSNSTE